MVKTGNTNVRNRNINVNLGNDYARNGNEVVKSRNVVTKFGNEILNLFCEKNSRSKVKHGLQIRAIGYYYML